MKKIAVLIVLTIFFSVFTTACHNEGKENSADTEPEETGGTNMEELSIGLSGKSDYVIMVDLTNKVEKGFASRVQEYLSSQYNLDLPLRSAKNANETEYKILIGNYAVTEEINDVIIKTDSKSVYFYAPDAEQYQLLDLLIKEFFYLDGANVKIKKQIDFLLSRDGNEDKNYGESIVFSTDQEYTLVYPAGDRMTAIYAQYVGEFLAQKTGLNITSGDDNSIYENEILFGSVSRSLSNTYNSKLSSSGEYAVGINSKGVALVGREPIDLMYSVLTFIEMLKANNAVLYESDSYISVTAKRVTYDINIVDAAALYREIYGTYATQAEYEIASLSADGKRQIILNEQLVNHLGLGFVVTEGSSSVLYNGFVVKLDTTDYSRKTYKSNGDLYIAAQFAKNYFQDDSMSVTADGFVNLSEYLRNKNDYKLLYKEGEKIYIILPSDNIYFDSDTEIFRVEVNSVVYRIQAQEFYQRMHELLNNSFRPEPENNTEQSRIVIDSADFDPNIYYDYTVQTHETMYSPAICTVYENEKEIIYVSYEWCDACKHTEEYNNVTYLKSSIDGGATWEKIGKVEGMKHASLFHLNGDIYLIGTNITDRSCMIAKYSVQNDLFEVGTLNFMLGGGQPAAILVANGRVWCATNKIISASVDSNLMKGSSWTSSNNAIDVFSQADFVKSTSLETGISSISNYGLGEGNVVVGPDGDIYAVFRCDSHPVYGYAIILKVSEDGRILSKLDDNSSVIKLPSTCSKFSVRYDEQTGLYVSITSLPTSDAYTMAAARTRNVLTLVVSRDMVNWSVVDVLLVDREIMSEDQSRIMHAYQYADFDFSGDSMRIIVREATGITATWHDGNYTTLYTIENYTELLLSVIEKS